VSEVAHKVVKPTQMAFKPGRHILEGVVIFHETIHEMHSNKMDGILLKIDFEWLQCPLFVGASRF
jgi:hypothetical protein